MFRTLSVLVTAFLLFSCQTDVKVKSSASQKLQALVDREELAGAVYLVADKNGTLALESVGYADRENKILMKKDTLFWIASQTKTMTAVAFMILVDEGKVSLDDPVEKYLPEFKKQMVVAEKKNGTVVLKKPARPFTVREVLCHVSGLPFRSDVELPTLDGLNLETKIRSYAMTPLHSEPGQKYAYSNAGISVAARIIEVVSGMKYEDFMQKRLLDPLGMKDTTLWPTVEQENMIAKTYSPGKDKKGLKPINIEFLIYPLSDVHKRYPMPGGGYFSTAEDVSKFCRMLLNGGELNGKRVISEKSVKELSRKQTPDNIKNSYGLGTSVGADWFGHGGACSTNMTVRPKDGIVLIWMVQHRGFPGEGKTAQGIFNKWAIEKFSK